LQNHQQLRVHKELLVIMEFSQAVAAVVVIPPQMGRELVDKVVVEMVVLIL
jgi:hypothetical protein